MAFQRTHSHMTSVIGRQPICMSVYFYRPMYIGLRTPQSLQCCSVYYVVTVQGSPLSNYSWRIFTAPLFMALYFGIYRSSCNRRFCATFRQALRRVQGVIYCIRIVCCLLHFPLLDELCGKLPGFYNAVTDILSVTRHTLSRNFSRYADSHISAQL